MGVGRKIVELRKNGGMTRKELAIALSITYDALSKYETDERQIDHDLLVKIADLFDITTDYILGRQTELVEEEGLFYGLSEEEKEHIREQAEFYRYRKSLPPDTRKDSSGLTNIDKGGKYRQEAGEGKGKTGS